MSYMVNRIHLTEKQKKKKKKMENKDIWGQMDARWHINGIQELPWRPSGWDSALSQLRL